jgi:hypothetical protein
VGTVSAGVAGVACTHDGTCAIAANYTDTVADSHHVARSQSVLVTVTGGNLGTAPGTWTAGGYYDSRPPTSNEQFLGLPGSSPPFVASSAS